jgi:biotin carboxylase
VKPKIIVVYGIGAASPSAVVQGAQPVADVVFVHDSAQPHAKAMGRVLNALAPSFDVATGYTAVLASLKEQRPRGIVTFSEPCLRLAARLGADLGLEFHRPQTVERLTDKVLQRTLLNRAGLSDVRIATRLGEIGVPFVVKPVRGVGSRDTAGCWTEADLPAVERLLRGRKGPWVVEQLMPEGRHPSGGWLGDYVSVESAVMGERVWHLAVTDKLPLVRPFREKGAIMPGSLTGNIRQEVLALASRAIDVLGVRGGLVHTEIKLGVGGPQVIEVNGRLGGEVAVLLRRGCGFDPVRLAMELALGTAEPVAVSHDRFVVHYAVLAPEGVFEVVDTPDPGVFTGSGHGVWRVEIQHRKGALVDSARGTADAIARVYAEAPRFEDLEATAADFDAIAQRLVAGLKPRY